MMHIARGPSNLQPQPAHTGAPVPPVDPMSESDSEYDDVQMNVEDDQEEDLREVIRDMEGAVTDDEMYDDNEDVYLPDLT